MAKFCAYMSGKRLGVETYEGTDTQFLTLSLEASAKCTV